MKKILVIYDDLQKPIKEIKAITGHKSFGDTIFKRVTLKMRMKEEILKNKNVKSVLFVQDEEDKEKLKQELINCKTSEESTSVVYLYSNFGLADRDEFQTLLTKACYINDIFIAQANQKLAAAFLPDAKITLENLDRLMARKLSAEEIMQDAFTDLSVLSNFLSFITGGFDARFFNALAGDEHTVTKSSTKIEKIKSEYNFYYLLPDDMKMWFVMPFDYKEDNQKASYTMERFHMTDIAIRFVHGAVDPEELSDILDKLFYFINTRKTKTVSEEVCKEVSKNLYVEKLYQRMEELKKYKEYEQFDSMLKIGTRFSGIREVIEYYVGLYQKVEKQFAEKNHELVVGHGDLCFSNILYSKEASLLKLIDPKGALTEDDLYMDKYYDLAKLSHSICGSYDFFNSGLFQVSMDAKMSLSLVIDSEPKPYIEIFKEYLEKNGFSYVKVRLYEASLFLSMLPYHMDQPGKVFGFLMNAINILEEVETCIKM